MRSIDNNNDGILNQEDERWNDIQIWFDNGDAVSEGRELKSLSDFVDDIYLDEINSITENPVWAGDNLVLENSKHQEKIKSMIFTTLV